MCLKAPINPPKRLPKKGYKWMVRRGAKTYESPVQGTKCRVGRWLVATGHPISFGSMFQSFYPAGFHCFASKRDARDHWLGKEREDVVLVAVEIDPDCITAWGAEGIGFDVRCFVARRIKLIGEVVEE